jgi:hypothetical protein
MEVITVDVAFHSSHRLVGRFTTGDWRSRRWGTWATTEPDSWWTRRYLYLLEGPFRVARMRIPWGLRRGRRRTMAARREAFRERLAAEGFDGVSFGGNTVILWNFPHPVPRLIATAWDECLRPPEGSQATLASSSPPT